jgi:Cof subfamily protein (haloacid dehalogenase superfamily)
MHNRHTLRIVALALVLACCTPPAQKQEPKKVRFPAIFLDMDGTTLGPDKRIHPHTLEAIRCYKANGGLVGIATARTWQQVAGYVQQLRPNLPFVLYNGAVTVTSSGDVIDATGLPPLMGGQLVKIFRTLNEEFELSGLVLHGAVTTVVTQENPLLLESLKTAQIEEYTVGDRLPQSDELIKALFVVSDGRVDEVRKALTELLLEEPVRVLVTSDVSVEVFSANVNKARTIEAIVRFQGLELRDVLAFGDGDNDTEMLSKAGLGIAMGNCRAAACEAAAAVIGPSGTDALGKFIVDAAIRADCPKPNPARAGQGDD